MEKTWQADAESHGDDDKNVKIETGSKIPTWRTFAFKNRKLYNLIHGLRCRKNFGRHLTFDLST